MLCSLSNNLDGQSLLAVVQRTFPSLQGISAGDFILVAPIPGYPDTEPVELLPEIWTAVCRVVHTVTITLKPGISLFSMYPRQSVTEFIFLRNAEH